MEAEETSPSGVRLRSPASAVVISLLLIFLALLGIDNEIRYQGCVSLIDQQRLIAVTQNPKNPQPVDLKCSRVPFK